MIELRLFCAVFALSDPPEEVPGPPVPAPSRGDEKPSRCREAYDYVLQPFSGKIASLVFTSAIGFFVAATTINDAKRVTLSVCYGFAAFSLLVAVVAAIVFAKEKIAEGRKRSQEEASRADQSDPTASV